MCRCSFAMSLFWWVFLCTFLYACNSQLHLASSHNIMWFSCFYVCSFSFIIYAMSIIDETFGKKLFSESFARENFLEILKEILVSSSFLSSDLFDLHPSGFYPVTPFITPSLIINVPDELLWFTNGDDIPLSCIMILISLIFILLYYILKKLVIIVGIFSTLTSICTWKILIFFSMLLICICYWSL